MTVPDHPATPPGGDPVLVVACREFVELVTEHLEGALPAALERAIAAHLQLCDPCVEYLEQMRRTVGVLRTLPTQELPPVVRNELLDVYARLHGAPPPGG
jgi:predicted anti-sigma-YlaC factor YlaD